MPSVKYGESLVGTGFNQIYWDIPGFAVFRDEGVLQYTWVPEICPAEIFDGGLSLVGLQVDEEWISGGVVRGTLVCRTEEDAKAT